MTLSSHPRPRSPSCTWVILIASIILCIVTSAHGQLLDYAKYAGYGLGKGIHANDYETPRSACITGTNGFLKADRADVRVSIVQTTSQLEQAFHIDQKAEATFLQLGGASQELHIAHASERSDSALKIVLEAYSEHPSDTIDNPKWDSPYDGMVRSGKRDQIEQVRAACGDRYIHTVFNEARLFAVLHSSSEKATSLSTISGNVSGKIGIDVLTATSTLGGDAKVRQANESGSIRVTISSQGLGGIAPSAAAIKILTPSQDGLSEIASKLAAYLTSLKPTGHPVKYRLAPLPGIPSNNLTDLRITEHLRDLKTRYHTAKTRLDNVNSLTGTDPRRILYRQPAQADKVLWPLKAALSTYVDAVAVAHDGCRQATGLNVCVNGARNLPALPARPAVELSPVSPPMIGPFMFVIDGRSILPGQTNLLLSNGPTLFEAARTLVPTASSVDVVAPVHDPYLSHFDIAVVAPELPIVNHRLLAQNLSWPEALKGGRGKGTFPLHVVHADAGHPCRMKRSGDVVTFDVDCVTPVGSLLRDIALAYIARTSARPGAPPTDRPVDIPLHAAAVNCFGQAVRFPLASLRVNVATSGNQVATRSGLSFPMIGGVLSLVDDRESHDQAGWAEIASKRLSAILASEGAVLGASPCAPHVL